jgi:hypothetical protein
MDRPEIVSREQWLAARKQLLAREKELTRAADELNAERRRLPMVRVAKDYRFTGPDGEVGLLELFDGRSQLVVQHVMFAPSWEDARLPAARHYRARPPGDLGAARGPGAARASRRPELHRVTDRAGRLAGRAAEN